MVTRRTLLAAVGTTAALSGCTGGSDDGMATTEPTETETSEPGTSTAGDATETSTASDSGTTDGATVRTRDHAEYGEILVGPDGLTLYMFDNDEQGSGESTCYDNCATAWPPLTVDDDPRASDDVVAELGAFEREDGATQVTANGWPLYYYASDEDPGDANGQGANDVWWVLDPSGSKVESGMDPYGY